MRKRMEAIINRVNAMIDTPLRLLRNGGISFIPLTTAFFTKKEARTILKCNCVYSLDSVRLTFRVGLVAYALAVKALKGANREDLLLTRKAAPRQLGFILKPLEKFFPPPSRGVKLHFIKL
jgi:hypothetical protein